MPAKQKKSTKVTRVSKKAKTTKPHFKIWVGVLVVLIIAVVGVVVVRFSRAGVSLVTKNPDGSWVVSITDLNSSYLAVNPTKGLSIAPIRNVYSKWGQINWLYKLGQNEKVIIRVPSSASHGFNNGGTYCVWGVSEGYNRIRLRILGYQYGKPADQLLGESIGEHPPWQVNTGVSKTSDGSAALSDYQLICATSPRGSISGLEITNEAGGGSVFLSNIINTK